MPQFDHLQVFQSLSRSPNARLHAMAELGEGLAVARWSNAHDARDYMAPSHHTLSCYLSGGTGTFRREAPGSKGAPDKLCILPAEHHSAWVINGQIQLAHLYVEQQQFALGAITLLDREPRSLQLEEATFVDDAGQAGRFRQLCQLDWGEPGERLLASALAHELLDHALLHQVGLRQGLRVRGGLAPHLRHRLRDFIEQHLAEPLTLSLLAGFCALSEYHFARMFQSSFGLPPHRYVLARRMALACHLLRHTRQTLSEIALACGFASASHFSHRFRQSLGDTPSRYRLAFAQRGTPPSGAAALRP